MLHFYNCYFTTCTILNWEPLLADDKYKDILIESFRYLVKEQSVEIFSFVIMRNHFHMVWQINEPHTLSTIQHRLLKYTAQAMKMELQQSNPAFLRKFRVGKYDRAYQIWKRKSLSKTVYTQHFYQQKVNYIHKNPCRSTPPLAESPADYLYSSAFYHETGVKNWDFLS
ncbi:MAG: transposase [Saprospiraceae bacterium]